MRRATFSIDFACFDASPSIQIFVTYETRAAFLKPCYYHLTA